MLKRKNHNSIKCHLILISYFLYKKIFLYLSKADIFWKKKLVLEAMMQLSKKKLINYLQQINSVLWNNFLIFKLLVFCNLFNFSSKLFFFNIENVIFKYNSIFGRYTPANFRSAFDKENSLKKQQSKKCL